MPYKLGFNRLNKCFILNILLLCVTVILNYMAFTPVDCTRKCFILKFYPFYTCAGHQILNIYILRLRAYY